MKKFSIFILLFLIGFLSFSQDKLEREHRIKKSQFPIESKSFFFEYIENAKRVRYYKEVDTAQTNYTIKFKKDRLSYHIDFDKNNNLQRIGFRITEVDVPSDTFSQIKSLLAKTYDKFKIRRIFQQYHKSGNSNANQLLKDAFQNMMLPSTIYKVLIVGKENGRRQEKVAVFDSEGNLKKMSDVLPANFNRVLY